MMHLLIAALIVLTALAAVVRFLWWSFAPQRKLPGNRVRHNRLRIRLRLHPGRGHATVFELWLRWGRFAAFRRSGKIRPSLPFWARVMIGVAAYSIKLGRAHYRHGMRVPLEEHVLVMAPPRTGKALALDTPVPTPRGWTTMGALRDGDVIFGADGKPTKVLHAWPVRYGRPCYEVEFSDGTVITADAEHLWLVNTRASRMSEGSQRRWRHDTPGRGQQHKRQLPRVLTTADMVSSVRTGSDGRANYSVNVAKPLDLPEAELPVPPYTLAAWLGDGASARGTITSLDPEVIAAIEAEGEVCKRDLSPSGLRRCPGYLVTGLKTRLRLLGVLSNKHIPVAYLRASEIQRRALLAGLLDTDGYCDRNGVVEFVATNERLARDVRHLASTLGYKSTLRSKPAQLYGKDCGTAWTVSISSKGDVLFRLSRKAARQAGSAQGRSAARMQQRYITDIRPVPSVPVRCITVDNPDSLYLVAETCIPTHNTGWLARIIMRYPGPVLSTTTKPDVYGLTSGIRGRNGRPVEVFNPAAIGGLASTFRWSPIAGCTDRAVAIRRADGFANAVNLGKDSELFKNAARAYLRALFHAAALVDGDMRLVSLWALTASRGGASPAEDILRANGAPDWAAELSQLRGAADKTAATNEIVMSQMLGFMMTPALAEAVLPGAGDHLDVAAFLRKSGTLYMIADSGGNEEAPLAPLFAAMTSELHYVATQIGQASPGGRLDPPLLMALDEITQICPVPLPFWLADSGGKGVQIIPVVHGQAQLRERWGDNGALIVEDTCGTKVWLPGITDTKTLEMASKLSGKASYRLKGQEHDSQHDVMTEAMVRQLPAQHALVVRGGLSPVVARLPMAWKDRLYKKARRGGWAVYPSYAKASLDVSVVLPDRQEAPEASGELEPVAAGAAPGEPLPWIRQERR